MEFRLARPSDAPAVATLHAESWRRHYRGAYSDAFLDGDVDDDRLVAWTERLRESDRGGYTVLAEDGAALIGFAHTLLDEDPRWGALLDNLHVAPGSKRRGIGSELLALTARAVVDHGTGLYLWVLEQNRDAQAFYEARGASRLERAPTTPPGDVPGRLNGSPAKLRYVWADPAVLLGSP